MRLKILSLNCFDISAFTIAVRHRRLQRLAKEIIALHPHIVCLQEINFQDTLRTMRTFFMESGYTVFPDSKKFGLNPSGLFSATTLPVRSMKFVKFRDQGKIFALDIFERMTKRGYTVMTISLPQKKTLTVVNTHLHAPFTHATSAEAEKTSVNQSEQILIGTDTKKQYILTGDLNIPPHNSIYKHLSSILYDPLSGTKQVTCTGINTHRKHFKKFDERIDYTFLSRDLKRGAKAKIIFDKPIENQKMRYHLSDHFSIWTEFEA